MLLIENKMIILYILLIFSNIACATKKESPVPGYSAMIINDDNIDCIKIIHPQWIDEKTYFDTTVENYNGLILSAFLKNNCQDTIELAMYKNSLFSSFIFWYYDEEVVSNYLSMVTDSFHTIPPGDSIYSTITTVEENYIHKIDSMRIHIKFKTHQKLNNRFIKVSREDF